MKLIDRYVREVGENLPTKMRADIETEIRSLIEDTLEGRSQAAGRPVDEAMVVEVLQEFGPPAKMAASYLPPRYLIGPRLFPTFLMVMRIVLIVMVVVALVRLGVSISEPGLAFDQTMTMIGEAILGLLTSALAALGNVVFVFAILEWALPKVGEAGQSWDPRKLEDYNEPERVTAAPLIGEIIFTLLAMLVLNLYPWWIGFPFFTNTSSELTIVPFFSEAFFRYVPWFTGLWALQIALNVFLLRAGRWQKGTRWMRIGLKALEMMITAMMIAGPSIVALDLSSTGMAAEAAQSLEQLAQGGVRVLLVVVLVLNGFDLVKMLYALIGKNKIPVVVVE